MVSVRAVCEISVKVWATFEQFCDAKFVQVHNFWAQACLAPSVTFKEVTQRAKLDHWIEQHFHLETRERPAYAIQGVM